MHTGAIGHAGRKKRIVLSGRQGNRRLRVAVVGGGIGGTALAVALLQRGLEVRLFEKAAVFSEVGAGIQMTPNAVKVIKALNLLDELLAVGFLPEAVVGRHWKSGRENFRLPLKGEFQRLYDAPFVHVHRADLHDIFVRQLPQSMVELAKTCVSVRHTATGAVAEFSDGTAYEADVVIGADGVRSVVRAALFGAEAPRFTGHMCYRSVIPVGGVVDYVAPESSFWFGPKGHVVTYYVNGGKAVNIVAVAETAAWVEESWNARSSRSEMMAAFQGWHPNIQKLFSQAQTVFRWGLFDRDPMARWSEGCVTLLGDAAHPMLPFLSQGAAMAIEDGFVLAAALSAPSRTSVPDALAAYEAERRGRTSRVQLEARERGKTYHLPSALAQARRDLGYWLRGIFRPQTTGIRADWVYEYDARQFAQRVTAGAAVQQ
jgi:salicylate hydroxylase